MGKDYSPKLFLSVTGIKKHFDTNPISYEEYSKSRDYSPGIINNVQRALLPFDYLEVEAIIYGKEEIIKLTELDDLLNFSQMDEQEFLKEKNKSAFLNLCEKINSLKEKVLILSRSESKNYSENIRLLSETIHKYKEFRHEFVEWFFSKHIEVPIIPNQKYSIEIAPEKIIIGNQDNKLVPISHFDILELLIPKNIEPGEKVSYRLKELSSSTKLLKLPQMQGAFLMFLMMERKEGKNLWMLNPEKHIDKLREITNLLELPIKYDEAIQENLESTFTWFNNIKNGFRRTMASLINNNLKNNELIRGNLINNVPKSVSGANAIYTLAKTIKKTDIVIFQK